MVMHTDRNRYFLLLTIFSFDKNWICSAGTFSTLAILFLSEPTVSLLCACNNRTHSRHNCAPFDYICKSSSTNKPCFSMQKKNKYLLSFYQKNSCSTCIWNSFLWASQTTLKVRGRPWNEAPCGKMDRAAVCSSSTLIMYLSAISRTRSMFNRLADLLSKQYTAR